MKKWLRVSGMEGLPSDVHTERWECTEEGKERQSYLVEVRAGKPLDVLGLKQMSLDDVRGFAAHLAKTAERLYKPNAPRRVVEQCPCCLEGTREAKEAFPVFGAVYYRCASCGHAFIREQPSEEALHELFTESEEHSQTYTDKRSLETRMNQVVRPKIGWVKEAYEKRFGHMFQTALDVGAGGGHIVAGLRDTGCDAVGYEISKASRRFAKETFGIDLRGDDFLLAKPDRQYDVVSFWGLLEYTPHLRKFIEAAQQWLSPEGMLVVEVPRFPCLSTEIQKAQPHHICRHLDPNSHVNTFSEASLLTPLHDAGFSPFAAWYFGMDVYELFVQLAVALNDNSFLAKTAHLIPTLQGLMDQGMLCDDLIVAAVREERDR